MDDYLYSLKTIADSLAVIHASISDMDLIQYILNSLGVYYYLFIDTLT